MAWIPSHQSLREHPKLHRFTRKLGINRYQAIGHLQGLWWWAMDYAPDGSLAELTAEDLSTAAGWEGDPDLFLASLVDARFVDANPFQLHNWPKYGGKLVEKRRSDAERKRKGQPIPPEIQPPSDGGRNDSAVREEEKRGEEETTANAVGGADAPAAPLDGAAFEAETPKPPPRRKGERRELSEGQRQTLLKDFARLRGVEWKIDRALNHKASEKWLDVYRGVRDWLRDDLDKQDAGDANENGRAAFSANGAPALSQAASSQGWPEGTPI